MLLFIILIWWLVFVCGINYYDFVVIDIVINNGPICIDGIEFDDYNDLPGAVNYNGRLFYKVILQLDILDFRQEQVLMDVMEIDLHIEQEDVRKQIMESIKSGDYTIRQLLEAHPERTKGCI